ncbi:MAG: isoprenylcysteine carboxylmethyltransferase family protein [Gammaproteobacteria bacterium]|jgi:protein-S-isoprenylcysteine O-methyltransferase Ste14|nr:isoprenylcysteine carboxylmethyltransferase family protein [Gammaproteobacteria bacterium]
MNSTTTRRWPWVVPILVYAAATLEMIIMVTPFAAYFYSVYTPLLHGLESSVITAWLPQFFLPHLAYTKIAAFRYVEWLGAFLALVGILGFFACAIQLYYGKFIKKKLVTGGLYGRVRHPQYLMLIIGGAGFLFLWPRFFILVTYLAMLGLYYMLARFEEETIRKRYGSETDVYLARVSMFNPLRKPRENANWQPLPRSKALGIWSGVFAISLLLAFGLRALAISQFYSVAQQNPNVTALSFRKMADDEINAVVNSALQTVTLTNLLEENPQYALYMQINDGRSQLTHLLIDLGMKADRRRELQLPDDGWFLVVSRILLRDPEAGATPDPFSLAAKIEPLYLVSLARETDSATVTDLTPDLFYPGFSRILF